MFIECDHCNESEFATKLLITAIYMFKFLDLLVEFYKSITGIWTRLCFCLLWWPSQVSWPFQASRFLPFWDNAATLHPGSQPRILMLILQRWFWHHELQSGWFLPQYLSYPSCYCILFTDHHLFFKLFHGVNMVHL